MRKQSGFTLIELMVVVAIIGILAAIAIPAYQEYAAKAQVSEGLSISEGIKKRIEMYIADHGIAPTDRAAIGLVDANGVPTDATDTNGKYVSSVDVASGLVTVTFRDKPDAHNLIAGKVLTLAPYTTADGTINWVCGKAGVPTDWKAVGTAISGTTIGDDYLPSTCKA